MSNVFIFYEIADLETPWVRRQCPICGQLLKIGAVGVSIDERIVATGWMCSAHGEVKPETGWGEPPYPEL